jgi:phosphatidylinositol alpha-1,6-mannosyltransferase
MSLLGAKIETSVLAYHGGVPELSPGYLEGTTFLHAIGCGSSRRRFVYRFLRLGLVWRPALVFVDHLHLAVIPYSFRWLVRAPYVLTCHGIEFDEPLSSLRTKAFAGAAERLANSHFTANRLQNKFPGISVDPCELGLDELAMSDKPLERVTSLPDALGISQPLGNRLILIVSRLSASERYKGHDQLIAIMPSLVEQVSDVQFVIVGTGDDVERLKAVAWKNGVGRAVLFTGFASGELLAALYSQCRLFAMPSRGEGFGLVYLEAMRFAKPCIASRIDAGAEVVADGYTGLLVDPDNPEELRGAVARLLTDDSLATTMGKAGLARLNDRYRFQHYRARLQKCLAHVVPELAAAENMAEPGASLRRSWDLA